MNIIQDVIKKGAINRPQAKNSCEFITIHDTANKARGANAAAHAKYIKTLKERTSWHYTVDDESVYQHLPDGEKSYHTSSSVANENSIAVELCVNEDGDFEKTKENAILLVRGLMKKHGIPAENLRAHRDWTGKNCPASLAGEEWESFLARCREGDAPRKAISIAELREMGYTAIEI